MLEVFAATDCVPSTLASNTVPVKVRPTPAVYVVSVSVGTTQVPSPLKNVVPPPPEGTIPNVEPPPYISEETQPLAVTLKCAELNPATPFTVLPSVVPDPQYFHLLLQLYKQ